jgi:hypothetical protein
VETDHLHTPAPGAEHRPTAGPTIHEAEGIDATLLAPEWECVQALRRGGVSDSGLYRLLRLRTVYRRGADPATDGLDGPDGLQRDQRALFARWLVAQGRLNEGD